MDSLLIAPNVIAVECQINASSGNTLSSNTFPTQEQLNGRTIVALQAFSNQDVSVSPISGLPIATPALWQGSFARFYTASITRGGKQIRPAGLYLDQLPMSMLRTVTNQYNAVSANITSASRDLFSIYPSTIDWTKSNVYIPAPVAISQTYAFLFMVYYLEIDQANDPSILAAYLPH